MIRTVADEERLEGMWVAAAEATVAATARELEQRNRDEVAYQANIESVENVAVRVLNDNASLERDCIQVEAMRRLQEIAQEANLHEFSCLEKQSVEDKLTRLFGEAFRGAFLEAPIPEYFGQRFDTKDFREMNRLVSKWVEYNGCARVTAIPAYLAASKVDIINELPTYLLSDPMKLVDWLAKENILSGHFATLKAAPDGVIQPLILPFTGKVQELLVDAKKFLAPAILLERLGRGSVSAELVLQSKIKEHPLGGYFAIGPSKLKDSICLALNWIFTPEGEDPIFFLEQSLRFPYKADSLTRHILKGAGVNEEANKLNGKNFHLGYDLSYFIAGLWFEGKGKLHETKKPDIAPIGELIDQLYADLGIEAYEDSSIEEEAAILEMRIFAAERESATRDITYEMRVASLNQEFIELDAVFIKELRKQIEAPMKQEHYAVSSSSVDRAPSCIIGEDGIPQLKFFLARDVPWRTSQMLIEPLPAQSLDVKSLMTWMETLLSKEGFSGHYAVLTDAEYDPRSFITKRCVLPVQGWRVTKSLVIARLLERLGQGFLVPEASMRDYCPGDKGPHMLTVRWFLISKNHPSFLGRDSDLVQEEIFSLPSSCSEIPVRECGISSVLFSNKHNGTNHLAVWLTNAWDKKELVSVKEPVFLELEDLLEKRVSYINGKVFADEDFAGSEEKTPIEEGPLKAYYEQEVVRQKEIARLERQLERAKERVVRVPSYFERADWILNGEDGSSVLRPIGGKEHYVSFRDSSENSFPWINFRHTYRFPEELGVSNYSYMPPYKEARFADPKVQEALISLEVDKEERDFDIISKSYKRLVLINHPDKGGDASKFIEITAAYNKIREILEVKNGEFYFSGEFCLEEKYLEANNYAMENVFSFENLSLQELEESLLFKEHFLQELQSVQEDLVATALIKLQWKKLVEDVFLCVVFDRINIQLLKADSNDIPMANQEKITYFSKQLDELDEVEKTIQNQKWSRVTGALAPYLLVIVESKRLSCQRNLAEMFTVMGNTWKLIQLQKKVSESTKMLDQKIVKIKDLTEENDKVFQKRSAEINSLVLHLPVAREEKVNADDDTDSVSSDGYSDSDSISSEEEEDFLQPRITRERGAFLKSIAKNRSFFANMQIEKPLVPKVLPKVTSSISYVGEKKPLNIIDAAMRARCGEVTFFRQILGDGNCFYTALTTGILEACSENEALRLALLGKITGVSELSGTVRSAIATVRRENLEQVLFNGDIIQSVILLLRELTAQSIRDSEAALPMLRRSIEANFPDDLLRIQNFNMEMLLSEYVLKMGSYGFDHAIGKILERLEFSVWLIDLENVERLPGVLGPQVPRGQCQMTMIRRVDHFNVGYREV